MNDNIEGHELEFDSETIWRKPTEDSKPFLKKLALEAIEMEAQRIERKIMDTAPFSGKITHNGECIGKLESISFGDETACTRLVPKTKTVFCTHNSYNLNRKTIIL